MTLLEDIQNSAIDSSSDLSTLLRKCKLLAAQLDSQQLEEWLIWESVGYPDDVEVPDYRVWQLEVKGHFAGPYGSGLKNANIPLAVLPEKARKEYENYKCRQSIASIESVLVEKDVGNILVSTGDLFVTLGNKVYLHQNCIHAWAEFGSSVLVELLNSVRNRILDFSLALGKEESTSGNKDAGSNAVVEPSKVEQIFYTTIYGGSPNFVVAATNSTVMFNIVRSDFSSVAGVLKENGLLDDDIQELKSAFETDDQPSNVGSFGPEVSSWIAKMMGKASEGSWAIGLGSAGNLLAQVISKFYGL